MSEFKLADVMQTTPQKAKQIIDQFFSVVPDLQKFLNMIGTTAVRKGLIRSDPHYKRIRWFPQLKPDDAKSQGEVQRAALNFPPQASNANLIKQCLVNLLEVIQENNYPAKMVLTIHDEILTEVPEAFAEEWKEIQEQVMKDTIKIIIKSIPVEVSTTIDKCWRKE